MLLVAQETLIPLAWMHEVQLKVFCVAKQLAEYYQHCCGIFLTESRLPVNLFFKGYGLT